MEPYRNCNRNFYRNSINNPSTIPKAPLHPCIKPMPLAMAFVNMQEWENMYDPCVAIQNGTAFPCLNLIFCGKRGKF